VKNEEWKQIGWFVGISIIVIFFQAVLSYQISKRFPGDASFLGIMYDNTLFIWGMTMAFLVILWYIIKKSFNIKTKKRGLT